MLKNPNKDKSVDNAKVQAAVNSLEQSADIENEVLMSAKDATKVAKGRKKQKILAGVGIGLGAAGIIGASAATAILLINKKNQEAAQKEEKAAHSIDTTNVTMPEEQKNLWTVESAKGNSAVKGNYIELKVIPNVDSVLSSEEQIPKSILINNQYSFDLYKKSTETQTYFTTTDESGQEVKCPCAENMTLKVIFQEAVQKGSISIKGVDGNIVKYSESSSFVPTDNKLYFFNDDTWGSVAKPIVEKNSGEDKWKFMGWYKDSATTDPWLDSEILSQSGTYEMYPKFIVAEHTEDIYLYQGTAQAPISYAGWSGKAPFVSVITTGQQGSGYEPTKFSELQLPTPSKNGSTFTGKWYKDAECKNEYSADDTFTKGSGGKVGIYPGFKVNINTFNVTFADADGTFSYKGYPQGEKTKPDIQVVDENTIFEKVGKPEIITADTQSADDYIFTGNWLIEGGEGTIDPSYPIKSNITIKPQVLQRKAAGQICVNFDLNGAEGTSSSCWVAAGSKIKDLSKPAVPTRTGYQFLGWATTKTATEQSDEETVVPYDDLTKIGTLYAVWKADVVIYTINFKIKEWTDTSTATAKDKHHGTTLDGLETQLIEGKTGTKLGAVSKPKVAKNWYEEETPTSIDPEPSKIDWWFKGWAKTLKDKPEETEVISDDTALSELFGTSTTLELYPVFMPHNSTYSSVKFQISSGEELGGNSQVWGEANTSCPDYPSCWKEDESAVFQGWAKEDSPTEIVDTITFPETAGAIETYVPVWSNIITVTWEPGETISGKEGTPKVEGSTSSVEHYGWAGADLYANTELGKTMSIPEYTFKNDSNETVAYQSTWKEGDTGYSSEFKGYKKWEIYNTESSEWETVIPKKLEYEEGKYVYGYQLSANCKIRPVWTYRTVNVLLPGVSDENKQLTFDFNATYEDVKNTICDVSGAVLNKYIPTTVPDCRLMDCWTVDGSTAISGDTKIKADLTLIAKYKVDPYKTVILNFDHDSTTFSGAITPYGQEGEVLFNAAGGLTWSTVSSRPTYAWSATYEQAKYHQIGWTLEKSDQFKGAKADLLKADTVINPWDSGTETGKTEPKVVSVYPVWESDVSEVQIDIDWQELKVGSSDSITANIVGGGASQISGDNTWRWHLVENETAAAADDEPTLSTETHIKFTQAEGKTSLNQTVEIQAIKECSYNTETKKYNPVYLRVDWYDPKSSLHKHNYVWIYSLDYATTNDGFTVTKKSITPDGETTTCPSTDVWSIDEDTLYDTETEYVLLTNVTQKDKSYTKKLYKSADSENDKFDDYTVTIGAKVASIKANFMADCTAFTGTIDFSYCQNKLTNINSGFMENCTAWTGAMIVPSDGMNIEGIGADFMAGTGTKAGGDGSTFKVNNNQNLNHLLTKVQLISNDFLADSAFGSNVTKQEAKDNKLVLPDTLESIGSCFLYNCKYYQQDLILPPNLIWVGNNFMYGCTSMYNDYPSETKSSAKAIILKCPMGVIDENCSFAIDGSETAITSDTMKIHVRFMTDLNEEGQHTGTWVFADEETYEKLSTFISDFQIRFTEETSTSSMKYRRFIFYHTS